MTQEYKENLIKWLVGNFETTPSSDIIRINGYTDEENRITDYLSENYTTTNCVVIKTIKSSTDGNVLCLLYDRDNNRSIMIVFDDILNPIALLTGYSSGTQFQRIMGINVGEDGNYFLIENTGTTIRFVMCNNITAGDVLGEYKVVLRKSYTVQGELLNLVNVWEIVKYPGLSKYLVIGSDTDMQYNINIATEIVVNVGAENEYNDFTFDRDLANVEYANIYYTLDGENIKFNIAAGSGNVYYELNNTDYAITTSTYNISTATGISSILAAKVVATGLNNGYLICFSTSDNSYHIISKNGNQFVNLLSNQVNYTEELNMLLSFMNINRIDGVIYGAFVRERTADDYTIASFIVVNNKCYISTISGIMPLSVFTGIDLVVSATRNYDLYNFMFIFGGLTSMANVVYNNSRYNESPYIDYNYFVPSHANIYEQGQEYPIFARGLYNFLILNNTSTAIVNVPNQYINDMSINSSLFGETNSELVKSSSFEKNIYENLLINFNNAITITNDDVYMPTPSTRLNNSVLSDLDYNNAKIGYLRVYYANSTKDIPVSLQKVSDNKYYIKSVIYTDSAVSNFQIISNDKQTIYDSFRVNLELNKIYLIQRTVEII